MNRVAVITVGKTHSGKTTFAKALERQLTNAIVVDQDNHAEILKTYYPALVPKEGANVIKYALTQTIVNHAVDQTDCHIILCNANRNRQGRLKLLDFYRSKGFTTILVNFDMADEVLKMRIDQAGRDTSVLRTVSSFEDVLVRQQAESVDNPGVTPTPDEADYLFSVTNEQQAEAAISEIREIAAKGESP
ncbi:AAA family ATPase [Planococcus citreus]|uniref:AAA domain-containing protein n=1 Tax=Planococcus citreus TaxID=1373 RepID=A0A497YQS8_9BACL|nr:AAA family ATPase [Planococcus citreus]RLJ90703.1 AAA domain-containing protein [Planococcus citreus]